MWTKSCDNRKINQTFLQQRYKISGSMSFENSSLSCMPLTTLDKFDRSHLWGTRALTKCCDGCHTNRVCCSCAITTRTQTNFHLIPIVLHVPKTSNCQQHLKSFVYKGKAKFWIVLSYIKLLYFVSSKMLFFSESLVLQISYGEGQACGLTYITPKNFRMIIYYMNYSIPTIKISLDKKYIK